MRIIVCSKTWFWGGQSLWLRLLHLQWNIKTLWKTISKQRVSQEWFLKSNFSILPFFLAFFKCWSSDPLSNRCCNRFFFSRLTSLARLHYIYINWFMDGKIAWVFLFFLLLIRALDSQSFICSPKHFKIHSSVKWMLFFCAQFLSLF